MGVVWQEPPDSGAWVERLEPLTKRPGKWARVLTTDNIKQAQNYAWQLNSTDRYRLPEVPKRKWQFRGAAKEKGSKEGAVFARLVNK